MAEDEPKKKRYRFTIRGMLATIAWLALVWVYVRDYDVSMHSGFTPVEPGSLGIGTRYFSCQFTRNDKARCIVDEHGEVFIVGVEKETLRFIGVRDNETAIFETFEQPKAVLSVGGVVIDPKPYVVSVPDGQVQSDNVPDAPPPREAD